MNQTSFERIFAIILILSLLTLILSGCKSNTAGTNIKAGDYTATKQGYGGDVTVKVTVASDGKLSAVEVTADSETPEIGGKAAPIVAAEIKDKQSLAVDTVSGATVTSTAVIDAATEALKDSGLDVDKLKKK